MSYLGDFNTAVTVLCRFNTHKADGTPITLAGTPAISVYKNSTTESTSGVTLTVDYDSRTGLQHVAIDTSSDGTFYAAGNDFDVVITTGTVDSISVVGCVVGTFSIENRNIKANVTQSNGVTNTSTGGYFAPDWGHVNAPTTTVLLTGTTIGTATVLTNLPAITTDWITAAGVKADAVTKIQAGLSTYAGTDTSGTTTLLARVTSSRAGYLDNLNVGGNVASQADVQAVNQSASKHVLIQTVGQYERPESGSSSYTVELRTFAALTGAAVNADSTPTIAPVGAVSGDLTANLGAVSNPATGVYRATYSVASGATQEQIRFDGSATINSSTFTISCYSQVVDLVSQTWTSTDATHLTAIYNKLPSNNIADETLILAAVAGVQADTDDIQTRLPAALVSGRMDVSVGAMATDSLSAGAVSATAVTKIQAGLSTFSGGQVASVAGTVGGIAGTTQTLDALQTALSTAHGDGSWQTATGFAVAGDPMILTTPAGNALVLAIAAAITSDHGVGSYLRNTEPPNAVAVSTQVASDLALAHGDGSWLTGTSGGGTGGAIVVTAASGNSGGSSTFSAPRGADLVIPLRFVPATSLAGMTLEFTAQGVNTAITITKNNRDTSDPLYKGGLTVTDAANSRIQVQILHEDTADLYPDNFIWSVHRVDPGYYELLKSGLFYLLP